MQTPMAELYKTLLLLSSKSNNDKYEKISHLISKEYENCLNNDEYDFNLLRNILQNWAEKNKKDCIICHSIILNDLFKNVKQNNTFELIHKIDDKEFFDLLELLKNNANTASFFDLTKKDVDLKGYKKEDVIVDIHNYINHFTTINDITTADIVPTSMFIAISCKLCMQLNRFDYLTRAIFMPFISTLYKKGFTQEARNQAETYYLYLKKYNQNHLAFLIHAHLYSFQKSPYLTAINLTFSIIYALKYDDLADEYVQEINIIYLRMLRDAQLFKSLEVFYNTNILKSNNEKLVLPSSLIYVHSLFYTNQDKAFSVTNEILNKYRELLFDNEHEAITSWLIVIFNLIKFNRDNEKEFLSYMEIFKRVLGDEIYNNLYSQIFSTEKTAKILKNALPKVINIMFDSDIGYDINNHVTTAKELIKDAYNKKSFEEIYLCLFYLMSPEFVREPINKNTKIAIMYSNDKSASASSILKNFEMRLKNFVKILNGDIAILVVTSEYMYQININSGGKNSIFQTELNTNNINNWINKNSRFLEIEDKDEYELFELAMPSKAQEESKNEITSRAKIELDIVGSSENIVIFRSFNNSSFPHNFYKDKTGQFLSLIRPLSLNFSIDELYAKNLKVNNDIGLWAPCESGDTTINVLYSRIEKFHQQNNISLNAITSMVPKEKLLNDIAVVITHGNSNIDETNKVYFTNDDLQIELTNILKENKVIILFVCHSGKQSLSDYSYSVDSIIKNLLKDRTKAIIAPCWPLSIDIAFFYYKNFINKLYQNISLGDIHFQIMKEMSEKNINPAVWGNLHYYGNPNINII